MLSVYLTAICSCIFFIIIFAISSADSITISYQNNNLKMGHTPLMLFKNALVANWIFIVLCGSLLLLITIVRTHRIAGPLFRFEKALDSMNRKVLIDEIHLRSKDEGKELADKINTFNFQLSKDLNTARNYSSAIAEQLQQNSMNWGKMPPEEAASLFRAIQENNENLKAILDSYTYQQ